MMLLLHTERIISFGKDKWLSNLIRLKLTPKLTPMDPQKKKNPDGIEVLVAKWSG